MKLTWTKEEEMHLCMLSKITIGTRCILTTCQYGVSDIMHKQLDYSYKSPTLVGFMESFND